MTHDHDQHLLAELAQAKRDRDAAKKTWQAKRSAALEAKEAWVASTARIEEILEELTGDRPLLSAIAAKANGAAAAKTPKRDRADAKLAGLALPTVKEILGDLAEHLAGDVQTPSPVPADAPREPPGASESTPAARPASIAPPVGVWDEDALFFAAKVLGVELADLAICGKCGTARIMRFGPAAKGNLPVCPCGSHLFHAAADELGLSPKPRTRKKGGADG